MKVVATSTKLTVGAGVTAGTSIPGDNGVFLLLDLSATLPDLRSDRKLRCPASEQKRTVVTPAPCVAT